MKRYLFVLILIPYILFSQENSGSAFYQSAISVRTGMFYQSIKIGDEKINQMAFPISVMIPVAKNFTVSIVNNPALSKNDVTDVNGLTETKIGLRYVALDDKLLLKVIAGLPTGKTKYSIEQFNLVKYLSTGSLDYYVSYYGRGFNSNVGISYAEPISKTLILGGGVSYYYKGDFYPLDLPTGGKYNPGDELTANLGLDYLFDKTTRFNFDVIYTSYAADQIDGVKKFQAASKLTLYSGLQFKYGKSKHSVYLLDRFKSNNLLYIREEEFKAESGNQLDVGYDGIIPLNIDLSLLLSFDAKIFGDIQQMVVGDMFETGKTNVFGGGLGLRIFLTDVLILDIAGKYKTGKINIIQGNISDERDVSGISAVAGLSFRF
jgi:hypothetical protein